MMMGYPGMSCSPLMAQKAHRNIAVNQTNHTLVTQLIVFQGGRAAPTNFKSRTNFISGFWMIPNFFYVFRRRKKIENFYLVDYRWLLHCLNLHYWRLLHLHCLTPLIILLLLHFNDDSKFYFYYNYFFGDEELDQLDLKICSPGSGCTAMQQKLKGHPEFFFNYYSFKLY